MTTQKTVKTSLKNGAQENQWTRLVEDGLARGYVIERAISDADVLWAAIVERRTYDGT